MTAPDDDLEEALRQALSAVAGQVESGDGGLDRIRARTSGATPRPWLLSLLMEVILRARHWVWRGHWAWQDAGYWRDDRAAQRVARLIRTTRARLAGTRLAASTGRWAVSLWATLRPHGIGWIRLVAGLAAVASITAAAVAVPPLRAALVQVSSTVLNGGNEGVPPVITGTGGSGGGGGKTPAVDARRTAAPSGSAGRGSRGSLSRHGAARRVVESRIVPDASESRDHWQPGREQLR